MEKGICKLSIIPLRETANDRSQMVTQLLFGETYSILKQEDKWLFVQIDHDTYEGWIEKKQYTPATTSMQNVALT